MNSAVMQRLTGVYDRAAACLADALAQFRDLGQIDGVAMASDDLGLLEQLTGDYQAAAASHHEALAIYTDCGRKPGQAVVLNSLGELSARTQQPAQAREYHRRALRIARDLPAPLQEARALEGIGRSRLGQDTGEAEIDLKRALAIYRRIGAPDLSRVEQMLEDLTLTAAPDPS
jgi:tetratricopeptide (TPR) repeat protein